jgi:hypothetical protein
MGLRALIVPLLLSTAFFTYGLGQFFSDWEIRRKAAVPRSNVLNEMVRRRCKLIVAPSASNLPLWTLVLSHAPPVLSIPTT